jgi:hypothetical protein
MKDRIILTAIFFVRRFHREWIDVWSSARSRLSGGADG